MFVPVNIRLNLHIGLNVCYGGSTHWTGTHLGLATVAMRRVSVKPQSRAVTVSRHLKEYREERKVVLLEVKPRVSDVNYQIVIS